MPSSPVVDGRGNARPEWREYLGATRAAIDLLRALIVDTSGTQGLQDRLSALTRRIDGLNDLAMSEHERLVIWRGTNEGGGTRASFPHGLGTNHIWWHLRYASGSVPGRARQIEQNEGSVSFRDDDFDPLPLGMDAVIVGVISDRY